jgi:hypothetical protein
LVDAFGLVVMHPVRCVGQALDAVDVWNIVAVGLGEVGAANKVRTAGRSRWKKDYSLAEEAGSAAGAGAATTASSGG